MRRALAAIAATVIAGCGADAVSTEPTDNTQIKVDRLFDHDGCTVYRFRDGETRYFVKCRDGSARTEWSERYQCGKSVCTRPVAIPSA